jgi:hypothetical protein
MPPCTYVRINLICVLRKVFIFWTETWLLVVRVRVGFLSCARHAGTLPRRLAQEQLIMEETRLDATEGVPFVSYVRTYGI